MPDLTPESLAELREQALMFRCYGGRSVGIELDELIALLDAAGRLAEVTAERDAALALVSEHRCDVQAEAAYDRVLRLRAERDELAAKVERVRREIGTWGKLIGFEWDGLEVVGPRILAALDGTDADHA